MTAMVGAPDPRSPGEMMLYDWRDTLPPGIEFNYPVGKYTIDLFEKVCGIAIEVDGYAYHDGDKRQAAKDKRRDRYLQDLGHVVLRYTSNEAIHETPMVIKEIWRFALKRWEALRNSGICCACAGLVEDGWDTAVATAYGEAQICRECYRDMAREYFRCRLCEWAPPRDPSLLDWKWSEQGWICDYCCGDDANRELIILMGGRQLA